MSDQSHIIKAEALGKILIGLGVIPPRTRRFVIDGELGCALKVYIEMWGDDRFLQIGLPREMQRDIQLTTIASLPIGPVPANIPVESDEADDEVSDIDGSQLFFGEIAKKVNPEATSRAALHYPTITPIED